MSVKARHMKGIHEATAYPGLLARLGTAADDWPGESESPFWDVLEPDISDEPSLEGRFRRALEEGEIAAAQVLCGWGRLDSGMTVQISRARAAFEQDVLTQLHHAMGLLLLLKGAPDPRVVELSTAFNRLHKDEHIRRNRPGRLLQELGSLADALESLVHESFENLGQQTASLRAKLRPSNERDLRPAIALLDQLLDKADPESLPAAQQLVGLAHRAESQRLNPDDLRRLHQEVISPGRVVRERGELAPNVASALEALELLQESDSGLSFTGKPEHAEAVELFRALLPRNGLLKPPDVARAILGFAGVQVTTYRPSYEGKAGCSYRFRFTAPRVPALSSPSPHFPSGIHLLVPSKVGDAMTQQLLLAAPKRALHMVYVAARLDRGRRPPTGQGDVAFVDNLDLLRLAECPTEARDHALQQILLPRLRLARIKPYQTGGPVAAEMFRGRRVVVDALQRPRGGTVLFSGRMIGKSSILTRIDRTIRAQARPGVRAKHSSVFVSSATEDLYQPLFAKLCDLVSDQKERRKFTETERETRITSTLRPTTRKERHDRRLHAFRSLIAKLLDGGCKLTILIDEADKFASADAQRPREESLAWLLRDLEYENPEHLRVVFAGFQAIHRQVLFRNGAFANWFGLQQLGPLDPEDAGALVTEPFADMGFVFSSEAGVNRICEFTARHPLLLQETCARLLDQVAARRADPLDEIIRVSAGDVEAVCRDDRLRERVRQVLSLNLEADPRLKLLVYLILFASGARTGSRSLSLDSFRLDDLREILLDFYGRFFSAHFDDTSIGALVEELMALRLLTDRGDTYEFSNRTYAAMIQSDRRFEEELERLLEAVTNPTTAERRVYPTLPREGLERLLGSEQKQLLLIGLPGTLRTSVVKGILPDPTQSDAALLVSAAGKNSIDRLQKELRKQLKEARRSLSIVELLIKSEVSRLVLDDADDLALADQLAPLAGQLASRGLGLIATGGCQLARSYVASLAAEDIEIVRLHRLSPMDAKAWGEKPVGPDEDFVLTIDESIARRLVEVSGGHLPLLHCFREFARGRAKGREVIPDAEMVEAFEEEVLTDELVKERLLAQLHDTELLVLRGLTETAAENGWAPLDWESVDDIVLAPLAGSGGAPRGAWLDALEVLALLDLVDDRPVAGHRMISVPAGRLLASALR